MCFQLFNVAEVALDLPIQGTLTYKLPGWMLERVKPGCVVRVPLRKKQALGVVLQVYQVRQELQELKEVLELLDEEPLFSDVELRWYSWAARYYMHPLGRVLSTALRPMLPFLARARTGKEGDCLTGEEPCFAPPFALTSHQSKALEQIVPAVCQDRFEAFLLWGVTGSGKTEVYLRAAQAAMECGKQALVLVPEISLTHQLVREFKSRFGECVAVLHSRLSKGGRAAVWEGVRQGGFPLVLGARSAVFAPCRKLGLIIVDEEHDSAYKHEEGFRYNARDLALMRGKLSPCPVLLGSATPSMETYCNARQGRFRMLRLPERVGGGSLPKTQIVDLRRSFKAGGKRCVISPPLEEAMRQTLERGEQVLLFLNRRGFATFLLCPDCGHVFKCNNCEVVLVHHLSDAALRCHYCGWRIRALPVCPGCNGTNISDLGVGTEALELEVKERFPEARVVRMDRDTTARKHAQREMLASWRKGEADILIGTQMVAKGHHVPNVTLVGVILADTSLNLPDFRASERTFQLLLQVAGRAGRGERSGKVILQTYNPEHPAVIFSAGEDYESFAWRELALRREAGYPPFKHLALIRISGPREETTSQAASILKHTASTVCLQPGPVQWIGPSPAPISRIKGRSRWQLLLKSSSRKELHRSTALIMEEARKKLPQRVILSVDIDPQSFL